MNLFEEYDGNLTNNRYVMLSAVNTNGLSLMFASKRLQNKDAIVMCAVNNNGLALHYASERLQDEGIVVNSTSYSVDYSLYTDWY